MSFILSSSFVSVVSGGLVSAGGSVSFGLPAGVIVTSNMAPVRFLPSACSRICMVSFGMVRRPSTATFARNSSSP